MERVEIMEWRGLRTGSQHHHVRGVAGSVRLPLQGARLEAILRAARPRRRWIMRTCTAAVAALASAYLAVAPARAGKLTMDERIELTRGLMAEYATVKAFLPRSKKPLPFESSGMYDKKAWEDVG